jgi:hypothetical protein
MSIYKYNNNIFEMSQISNDAQNGERAGANVSINNNAGTSSA